MTEIAFYANGQRLESKNEPLVVAKSRNEYQAAFTFSADWADVTPKTAVFRRYSDGQSFTADLDSNGKCIVPWEVLEAPRFHISVYGGDLRTMTETYINVEKTGYDENAVQSGTVPQIHPTPTDLKLENNNLHLVAGQTKIGGGIAVPHMELLNDITLTEDVTDITRAADDSGKPFKLKEFFLIFAGKCPSEANGVVRLRFNGGLIYSAYHRYTFPKNTDDTNRLLWFYSKKLFDGAYLSTYASQFIRDTDGNDAVVNGQIRCQGLINSNCAPHSDLYFRFPVENTANFQTASSWQFGVTGDLKLLAGSRIIALGVRE